MSESTPKWTEAQSRAIKTTGMSLLVSAAASVGATLLIPSYFQLVLQQTPMQSGLHLVPVGLGALVTLPLAGAFMDKHGPGKIVLIGLPVMAVGLGIVNYALTLEYLETQFYADVVKSGLFKGKTLSVLKSFGAEEAQHVAALHKAAMSMGKPAAKPVGKFPLKSAASVTKLAAAVENLGAAAYLGQAPAIKSKEVLAAALSIHSIEARHAATLNTLLKKSPTPDGAFAKPMSMAQVLAVVKPFIA